MINWSLDLNIAQLLIRGGVQWSCRDVVELHRRQVNEDPLLPFFLYFRSFLFFFLTLQAAVPTDDDTLAAMTFNYRMMNRRDQVTVMFEAAVKAKPGDVSLVKECFMCYVRVSQSLTWSFRVPRRVRIANSHNFVFVWKMTTVRHLVAPFFFFLSRQCEPHLSPLSKYGETDTHEVVRKPRLSLESFSSVTSSWVRVFRDHG